MPYLLVPKDFYERSKRSQGVTHVRALCQSLCVYRYDSHSGGEREIQRTMLELLNQLDGFDSKGDVKVHMILFVA